MERFITISLLAIVVATIWMTVDALIVFNSLDLAKIIGG